MTEVWDKIEELAKLVEKGYKNISLINSDKSIVKSVHENICADYVQFAYKLIMPRWIFEGNTGNEMIASDYAQGLMDSEINYLIRKMKESQKSKNVYLINDINYKELINCFTSIENATDVFIPLNLFYNPRFYRNFEIERRKYLKMGNKKFRVHHSNKFVPFDKILILDSSGVTWSQKKVKDMAESRAKDPEGLKLLTNEDNILQISAKINDLDSVLFIIRLVASASINPEKVRMVNISKKLLKEKT